MRDRTCLSLSAKGRAGKPHVDGGATILHPFTKLGRQEVLYEPGIALVLPDVLLSELYALRETELPFGEEEVGPLRLSIRLSHLQEFHRELGEFLAKQNQSVELSTA